MSRRKILLLAATICVILVIVLPLGKRLVERVVGDILCARVEARVGVTPRLDAVELSWRLDSVGLRGIRLENPPAAGDGASVTVDAIEAGFERGTLLGDSPAVNRLTIRRPVVRVHRDDAGVCNWAELVRAATVPAGAGARGDSGGKKQVGLTIHELIVEELVIGYQETAETPRDFTVRIGRLTVHGLRLAPDGTFVGSMRAEAAGLEVINPAGFAEAAFCRADRVALEFVWAGADDGAHVVDILELNTPIVRIENRAGWWNQDVLRAVMGELARDLAEAARSPHGAPAAGAEAAEARLEVKEVRARDAAIEKVIEGSVALVFSGAMEMRGLRYPASSDHPLALEVEGHVFDPSARLAFHLEGTPHASGADRFARYSLTVDRLPLEPVLRGEEVEPGLGVAGGTMRATSTGTIIGATGDAHVVARFSGLKFQHLETATLAQRAKHTSLLAAVAALKERGSDETVPVDFSLQLQLDTEDVRVAGLADTILHATVDAAVVQAFNLASVGADAMKAAGRVTDEHGPKIVESAGQAVETLVRKSKNAASAIADFLGGLVPGRKETPDAATEEQEAETQR